MNDETHTWHYGIVARYWAERNVGGPEIDYVQKQIERNGQPALDAGCGTGRLLIPFLRAGLDVDGCDVSGDMLALCREKAESEGLSPRLYRQALHELDLPRSYQTIAAIGAFGIGVNREQDFRALQRFYAHLNPGGLLLLDNHLAYESAAEWQLWLRERREQLPDPWPEGVGSTPPDGGTGYALHSRVVAFDPLEQRITREMRAELWRDGQPVAQEEYVLTENFYMRNELRLLLERAGFHVKAIQGDYTEVEATVEHGVLVFLAHK